MMKTLFGLQRGIKLWCDGVKSGSIFKATILRRIGFAAISICFSDPGVAQSWQVTVSDSGALIRASAQVSGGTVGFECTAPSPQGRPLIETGDHESHRTDAYQIVTKLSDTLFQWQPPYRMEAIVLQVGQTGYRLPPMELNELQGSGVYLSMTDPMIIALMEAPSLVLNTGQGTAFDVPVDGLSEALVTAIQACAGRWMELGAPISAEMNSLLARGIILPPGQPNASANLPPARPGVARDPDKVPIRRPQPTDGPAISFSPPLRPAMPGQSMEARATQTANDVCGASAVLGEGTFWPGDIDGDGQEDIVMDWGFVECPQATGALTPVPGACETSGQCRKTLFSSALIAKGMADLSLNAFHAVPERPGVSAGQVFVSTREPFCGATDIGYGCMAWLRFTGAGYEALNQTTLTSDFAAYSAEAYASTGPTQTLPTGLMEAPQMPIPNAPPVAIDDHLRGLCQGDYTGDESSVQASDVDADGIVDFLVNWNYVICQGTLQGRALCGAANCRIDVFLSSRGYARPEELLGTAADFVQNAQGRIGVLLGGTGFVCADGACDTPWFWNGTQLAH